VAPDTSTAAKALAMNTFRRTRRFGDFLWSFKLDSFPGALMGRLVIVRNQISLVATPDAIHSFRRNRSPGVSERTTAARRGRPTPFARALASVIGWIGSLRGGCHSLPAALRLIPEFEHHSTAKVVGIGLAGLRELNYFHDDEIGEGISAEAATGIALEERPRGRGAALTQPISVGDLSSITSRKPITLMPTRCRRRSQI
jgi:hypothetical protein